MRGKHPPNGWDVVLFLVVLGGVLIVSGLIVGSLNDGRLDGPRSELHPTTSPTPTSTTSVEDPGIVTVKFDVNCIEPRCFDFMESPTWLVVESVRSQPKPKWILYYNASISLDQSVVIGMVPGERYRIRLSNMNESRVLGVFVGPPGDREYTLEPYPCCRDDFTTMTEGA